MGSFKSNLAVGFGLFLVTALTVLAMIAVGVVIDTIFLGFVIFAMNLAIHLCGGWGLVGLYNTLAYAFVSALVLRAIKLVRSVIQ